MNMEGSWGEHFQHHRMAGVQMGVRRVPQTSQIGPGYFFRVKTVQPHEVCVPRGGPHLEKLGVFQVDHGCFHPIS